jgi:hypothetical protein
MITTIFQLITNPISPPPGISSWIDTGGGGGAAPGLIPFANALLKLIITLAGLFAFLNIIIAGYQFMSAGGDSKKIGEATSKIWQSLIGLLLVAGSFVLAAIFGWLLFGNALAILQPQIYGP